MKLLGWMHRKFRQNSGDVLRDPSAGPTRNCFSGGGAPLDDPHRHFSQLPPAGILGGHETGRNVYGEGALLFDGLLSIGTLGCDSPICEEQEEGAETTDSETDEIQVPLLPPPPPAVEAIAEKEETEAATETELAVVGMELEKVLTEAAEKEGDRLSSGRPSHASRKASDSCPLQEYLFCAAVEAGAVDNERKEVKRATLWELFMIEEGEGGGGGGGEGGGGEKKGNKGEEDRRAGHVLKRMLKRRGSRNNSNSWFLVSGGGGAHGGDGGDAKDEDAVKNAKLQKIMKIFHRKVHPDENGRLLRKKAAKFGKYAAFGCGGGGGGGGGSPVKPVRRSSGKGSKRRASGQAPLLLDGSGSASGREHWIRTDADYLVLEL